MNGVMNGVKIGVTLPQFTSDPAVLLDGARRAEATGIDTVWLFDHLWPLSGGKSRPILEAWTTLAYVAARTESIGLGTLVTRSSLRNPALLARMAATASLVARDRLIVAIGSGDAKSRAENLAFGMRYLGPDDRVDQLAGVVEIVRRHVGGETVTFRDRWGTVAGLPSDPGAPCPVWVGGRNDEVLEIAGRLADGWNAWASTPVQFARDAGTIVEAARGRPVELSWGGVVVIDRTTDAATARLRGRDAGDRIVGDPATIRGHMEALVDAGARHLIAAFPDAGAPGAYELWAETFGRP